jgi:chromosome segregation ATPase
MTLAELTSFIAVAVALYSIISQRRYVTSQADSNNVETAIKLRHEMQIDRDDTRKEYEALAVKFAALQKALAAAHERTTILTDEIADMQRRVSQLDLMFNSLLKGAWQLHRQLVENGYTPVYLPPKEYVSGPLAKSKE